MNVNTGLGLPLFWRTHACRLFLLCGGGTGSRISGLGLAWRSRYLFPGATVFNRTLRTLHDGYLTRTEIPAFHLLLLWRFDRDFSFTNLSLLYRSVPRRYDATPTEKGEFSRCNLAVEANVSALRSVAYLMICWLCFCTNRLCRYYLRFSSLHVQFLRVCLPPPPFSFRYFRQQHGKFIRTVR